MVNPVLRGFLWLRAGGSSTKPNGTDRARVLLLGIFIVP
jgi:hypothetical protein